MELSLYRNQDTNVKIGKHLTDVQNMEVWLKSDVDIDRPLLRLTWFEGIETCNYAKMVYQVGNTKTEKFYFIDAVNVITPKLVTVQLRLDVLETYADQILNGTAVITKSEKQTYFESYTDRETRLEIEKVDGDIMLDSSAGTTIIHTIGVG